ncbi:TadE family protein [Agromyces allii]|uniref:TadE family protein n=1 Tax=Agromyces allii TaxID=393607 RepID=A0ABP5BQQ3_9MICO|nr:TadE family protein [Agromyces allii]
MRRSRRSTESGGGPTARLVDDEAGSASLEFLTVGLLLLVPIVYLVLSVAAIQAGAFAVEGAARHAARIAADGAGASGTPADVERAVRIALEDFGVDADTATVAVTCASAACNVPGERIDVVVSARVMLPLVPDVLGLSGVANVPIESGATQTVSRFAGVAP